MKPLQQNGPGEEALGLLLQITGLLHKDATSSLAERGLTPARTNVLWHLGRSGPHLQRELAEAMDVSPRNVTGLVDGLVAEGFVTREPHPRDRRATLVTLTRRGTSAVRRLEREHEEFVSLLFGAMPTNRVKDLARTLRAVVERLQELGMDSGWEEE